METVASDLQQMLGQSQKADSILGLLGMDTDSTFRSPKTHHIYNDPYHITQGSIQPGQQIQVHIDAEAVHYLHQCMISGQIVTDKQSYPQNILHVFRCEQVKIGDVTLALNDSPYFVEQQFCRTNQALLSKQERGLLVTDPKIIHGLNYQDVAGVSTVFDQPIIPVVSNVGAVTFETLPVNRYPHAFQTELRAHYLKLGDKGDQDVVNFAIPLHMICPSLQYLSDLGAVYAGKNQPIQLTLALTNANECLFWMNPVKVGLSPSYSIQNLCLLDVYTVLDAPRQELINRSQMRFPICSYVKYKEPVISQTVNAIFSLSKYQRAKKLMFAFHYNGFVVGADDANSTTNNLLTGTAANYKSQIGFHPILPISQIILNWGGRQYQLNAQTLLNLQILECSMADDDYFFSDPVYRNFNKYVFSLDLQRFALDDLGSSLDTGQVYVQLQLRTGVKTVNQQQGDWSDQAFANYKIEFHLVCEEFIEMVGGRYKMSQ